jgi:hypothetical protein
MSGAQQRGVHPHVHGGEELAVVFKGRDHVIDLGLAKGLQHGADGAGLAQLIVVGTHGQRFALVVAIGAEHGDALAIADVDVVDGVGVAHGRHQHGVEGFIALQCLGDERAQLGRVVGIDGGVLEAVFEGILQGKSGFFGPGVAGVVVRPL